ncbi:MAG: VanZ family protein [Burkholderiales bacterium]
MRALALAGGWLYAAAIVFLSLTPSPPQPGFEYGDKLGHLLAYAMLMLWFAALHRSPRARIAFGALWIGLGVALEFAQGATGYRSFELSDMAANALGVAAGAAAALILPRAAGAREKGTP